MNAVKKMAMIIVMQNDLQAAVDFYKKLGLTLVFHVKDRWAEFKIDSLQIGLCPTEEKIQYNRTGIVFEVADLVAFYQANKESMSFLDKPVEAAHGIMASIQDPSGNIIDLYQPDPEKIKKLAEVMNNAQSCGDACACDANSQEKSDSCCKDESASQCC